MTATQMHYLPCGRWVAACGIVTARQQPPTAKGVVFITLEDESGSGNMVVWTNLREQQCAQAPKSRLLAVHRVWQRNDEQSDAQGSSGVKNIDRAATNANQPNRDEKNQGEVRHPITQGLVDLTHLLGELATQSRGFHKKNPA